MTSLIFFGSFQHHSVAVLEKLQKNFQIIAVVTTPPKPAGRKAQLKPTEVSLYAKEQNIPVLELESLSTIPPLTQPDFLVVAGYGKLIPKLWLDLPKVMAINMHPSLLPAYAGAMPAEWAILNGETETGVTLIKMSEQFDAGEILAQQKLPITPVDTRETLYTKLYALGSEMLIETLPKIIHGQTPLTPQGRSLKVAKRLSREDGFVTWEQFQNPQNLATKFRALSPWPGVWSLNPENIRIKLISLNPLITKQEGK